MTKPKKRTKKYQPKPVAQHGGLVAIAMCHARGENASKLKDDQLTDLGVAYWLSFENLRTGDANEESWSCVACALNVALVLSEKGIGAEYEEVFVTALDGEALRDIEQALLIHDQQMALAKRWEVTKALQTVHKRRAAGNVYQEAA